MQTMKFTRSLRALVMAGAVATITAGALATPALADDWHGHGGWGDHDHDSWRDRGGWHGDRDDWRRGPAYGYGYSYGYSYASPYAYYPYAYAAPAPVYTAPPSVGFYFGIR